MNILFYISIIVFTGIIISKVLSKFKLPKVTGYLIGGLIIGPSLLGIIPGELVGDLRIISDMALAFIAYNIGSEFNFIQLKNGQEYYHYNTFSDLQQCFCYYPIAVISGQPSFSLVLVL